MTFITEQKQTKNYAKASSVIPSSETTQENKLFSSGDWVSLIRPLTSLCFEEAILLCEESLDKWVAWVPGLGETRLNTSEFVRLA
jgi:hypothetical protein